MKGKGATATSGSAFVSTIEPAVGPCALDISRTAQESDRVPSRCVPGHWQVSLPSAAGNQQGITTMNWMKQKFSGAGDPAISLHWQHTFWKPSSNIKQLWLASCLSLFPLNQLFSWCCLLSTSADTALCKRMGRLEGPLMTWASVPIGWATNCYQLPPCAVYHFQIAMCLEYVM